uniref:Uncharacterized protein n=1 Tax=Lotharella globosa TaxID=91324 RepID=A0A7S3YJB9_9EUKA
MAEETKKETQSEMVPIIATEGTMVCPGCKTTLDCPSGEPWIVCGKCKAEFCTEKGDDAEGAAEAKYELNWRVIHKFKYVEEKEGKGNPFPHLVFPSPFPEHLEYLGLTEEEVKGEIDDLNKILQKTELSKCCYFFICETQESADRTRSKQMTFRCTVWNERIVDRHLRVCSKEFDRKSHWKTLLVKNGDEYVLELMQAYYTQTKAEPPSVKDISTLPVAAPKASA